MSKRYQIRAISWGRRSNKSAIVEAAAEAAAMAAWRRGARIVEARSEDGEVRWTKWIPKTDDGEIIS